MRSFRTVPRYFLRPALHATYAGHPVTLIDLSIKGVRLEATCSLPLGESGELVIDTHDGAIRVSGIALWCQLDDLPARDRSERYLAGIMLEHASDEIGDLLERLLKAHLAVPIEDNRGSDRFIMTHPLQGGFNAMPSEVLDLSIRGARVSLRSFVQLGTAGTLSFQVGDEEVKALGTVMWCIGANGEGFEAGLMVEGAEDRLRIAINRLCMRDEARIDLHSLRRRFNALRAATHEQEVMVAS